MDAKNFLAPFDVRPWNDDASVKPSGSEQSRIEHVGAVRGGDQNHAFVRFKTVHFHEQRVQRLLALVVPAAEAGTAVASHSVDFIDEDDARGVFLALLEKVAHTARADADKHFDEVGT